MGVTWTDERVEVVRTMWSGGFSATEIAIELGDGATRNAVIGKIFRLDLPARAHVARPKPTYKRPPRLRHPERAPELPPPHRLPAARPVPIAAPPSLDLPLLALDSHTCRWPYGDGTYSFCGHAVWNSLPYCEFHARRAYNPRGA